MGMDRHSIGLVPGRNGQWVTYCIECSDRAQEWTWPCRTGQWIHMPVPKFLHECPDPQEHKP